MSRPRRTLRLHRREPDHLQVLGRSHLNRPAGPLARDAARLLEEAALARLDGQYVVGAAVLPYPRLLTIARREHAHV